MSLWRVEWLRIWRTRTAWVLFGLFIFFGVLGPLTAQFLPDIVERAGVAGEIALPPTSPELAMSQYVGNALQIGVLAIAFIAATTLAFDSKPEIAVFYRTRSTVVEILTPRYVVIAATAVAAFISGTLIAFALSTVLIGTPDALSTLKGSALISLYIVLAVALVGLMSSLIPSVPGAALLAVGTLIILGYRHPGSVRQSLASIVSRGRIGHTDSWRGVRLLESNSHHRGHDSGRCMGEHVPDGPKGDMRTGS
jgi:ABC-2 type transport system permease protein